MRRAPADTTVAAGQDKKDVNLGARALGARALRVAGTVALVAVGVLLLVLEARVLMVLLAGLLFALALRGVALAITKRVPIPYSAAVGTLALAVVATLALAFYALGAGLLHQTEDLGKQLPAAWDSLLGTLRSKPGLAPLVDRLQHGAAPAPGHADLAAGASGVMEALGAAIVVFFVGVYGAAQPAAYPRVVLKLVPREHRRRTYVALSRVGTELTRWLAGRAVAMAVVGVLVTAGLLLLRIPMAWALGGLAGLLTFVEYLGAFASAAPAMLVALSRGGTYAIWVAVLFTVAHILEGYVLTPLLVRTTVRFPPAYTLAVQTLLGAVYGVAGLTFATPILIVGTVLVKTLYLERRDGSGRASAAARLLDASSPVSSA